MKKQIWVMAIGLFIFLQAYNQEDGQNFDRNKALNIYLDCAYCDMQYFKTEFTAVNYVYDRASADVHILVTDMGTGGGGTEFTLQFIGMKRFSGLQDTLVFDLDAQSTQDNTRAALLRYVRLGLVPYLMKTPARDLLVLFVEEGDQGYSTDLSADPWRGWIFQLNGGGSLVRTKSQKSYSLSGFFNVYKVSPEIKFESYNMYSFSEQKYRLYDGDSLIYSSLSSYQHFSNYNLFVKSLGDHAGIGVLGGYMKDNVFNIDHQFMIGPAFEYNIYPYSEATRKQFRFAYTPDYLFTSYIDSTINNKITEHRFIHQLKILATYVYPSYSIDAGITAVSSLTDFSEHQFQCSLSWNRSLKKERLFFNIYASFSYTNDQVGLKKSSASSEDLLLNQREFESDFDYSIGFGISFYFGSKGDNTVNPRFDIF